ncbi:MAG: SRPBCC domain-containing protein [Solirubrobacteraceae bacterium]
MTTSSPFRRHELAVDEITTAAPPERVFAVLSDRNQYQHWVVGTEHTTEGEGDWPQPGSTLRYTIAGPLKLSNRTVVKAVAAPHRLELRAKAGPMPDADITLDLIPEAGGTRIRMHERPANKVVSVLTGPLGHFALSRRNQEALERLRRLAESA